MIDLIGLKPYYINFLFRDIVPIVFPKYFKYQKYKYDIISINVTTPNIVLLRAPYPYHPVARGNWIKKIYIHPNIVWVFLRKYTTVGVI